MLRPRRYYSVSTLAAILLSLLALAGCGNNQPAIQNARQTPVPETESEPAGKASDSLEDLMNHVRLPEVPDEVVWQEQPGEHKLTAVLKFEAETLPKIVAILEKNKLADSVDVEGEDWFPEELTAQSQLSGEGMLKGTAYAANEFYNIPYGSGRIVRIKGTDYFVLELTEN